MVGSDWSWSICWTRKVLLVERHMMTRHTFLPFALPDVDNQELIPFEKTLDSGWVTSGPKTRRFEAQFAAAISARRCR